MNFILSSNYNLLNPGNHLVLQAPQLIKQGESFHIISIKFLFPLIYNFLKLQKVKFSYYQKVSQTCQLNL